MMKLLSCRYSMDTDRVESRFTNCTMLHSQNHRLSRWLE